MKIALIGPAHPYRGGIAHHINMMARTMRGRGHEVEVITFSRQYPAFLYPGAFQEEGGEEFSDIESKRLLDSMNPVTWITTARYLRRRQFDLYLTRFWIPLFGLMYGHLARRLGGGKPGGRVVTVVDNLFPHEVRPGDDLLRNYQFRYCNGAITQSGTVQQQLRAIYPALPEVMLPHPVYENFGEPVDKKVARKMINEGEGPLLLFFGFVRKYKGLDLLIEAMPEIGRRLPGARLLVVGEFFEDGAEIRTRIRELGLEQVVRIHDTYVPNEEVATWFSAADLLVLPYRSATNSGIVQIGYNFATPSVVTDVGSLSEVVLNDRTGYVVPNAEPDVLADAVARAFQPGVLAEMSRQIVVERERYSWNAFVEGIESFVDDQIF